MIRIGVTIHINSLGKISTLRAMTVSVNDHGALVISPQQFPAGAHFTVENNNTRERILCRVTRLPQSTSDGFHVPVEFEKPAPNFWRIAFPPRDWKPVS